MLFCLASDVVETEFLFIFVQINKGKQLFIPLANRGNFIRRLFEPGMAVVSTVLCLDLRIGAGTGTGRFSCSGSLKPALRGTDLRFFAGNKAARSLFRGGVRRCITVGISDEIPVLPSRLDFRGGGCDLGVTDNILPGGFLFLPFVSEDGCIEASHRRDLRQESHPPPLFFGDGPTANTSLHTKVSPGGRFPSPILH